MFAVPAYAMPKYHRNHDERGECSRCVRQEYAEQSTPAMDTTRPARSTAAVAEFARENAGDGAEAQAEQRIRALAWRTRTTSAPMATPHSSVLRDRRHHAVHDGEHAGHGKQRGKQQAPGPALLEIVSRLPSGVFLARLDVPEYHEEHDRQRPTTNGHQSPGRLPARATESHRWPR